MHWDALKGSRRHIRVWVAEDFPDIGIPNSFETRVEPQSSVKACWLHPPVVGLCADSHIFKQGIPNVLWQ